MGESGVGHDFGAELAYSVAASAELFWDAVYHKAFPGMAGHMPCPNDGPTQRMGVDRVILLSNGRSLYIDEKKRREVRNDILLEYLSNDRTNAPGWIEKDLAIDYLAYAFMPSKRVHLFPWLMLRRAWLRYSTEWKAKYGIPPAQNATYRTHSVAVPIPILRRAVSRAALIDVSVETDGMRFDGDA